MLSAYFDPLGRRFRALHNGPSGVLCEGFAHILHQAGYPTSTARKHLGAAEHLLHWTAQRRWSVAELIERSLTWFHHHLVSCNSNE